MSKDNRIYIRVDDKFKQEIEVAADLANKSIGELTRLFWIRYLEDQDGLIEYIASIDEGRVCPQCNSLSEQQREQQS